VPWIWKNWLDFSAGNVNHKKSDLARALSAWRGESREIKLGGRKKFLT
jgi:hypothetical protein